MSTHLWLFFFFFAVVSDWSSCNIIYLTFLFVIEENIRNDTKHYCRLTGRYRQAFECWFGLFIKAILFIAFKLYAVLTDTFVSQSSHCLTECLCLRLKCSITTRSKRLRGLFQEILVGLVYKRSTVSASNMILFFCKNIPYK